ncbi:MAG: RNA 2',3'-cyclic phosphodiesterase [Nitrospirae bacterium]|jgi:2'-5' RNA ligase|nr:RNA 2',3'-cyclic phosphodiesterase [Nitrospirota bacterium]
MDIRCFIAVDIPDSIKKEISDLIEFLKKNDADIKWVSADNLHITLKFLGNTPEKLIAEIRDKISILAKSYKPFYIKIKGTGVFPNIKYPRICWIGIEYPDTFIKLQKDIDKSMKQLGFKEEERDFKPHLTIGRIRSKKGTLNIIKELDNNALKEFGNVFVDSLKIMRSVLKPTGSEYSSLHEIKLDEV